MPVMPAPMTRTSTAVGGSGRVRWSACGFGGVMASDGDRSRSLVVAGVEPWRDPGGAAPSAKLYRPVSLTYTLDGARRREGARMAIVEQRVVGAPGALRDRVPGPGPQGALLRPGLLRRWRPSSSGHGSGRWPVGSRRSPRPDDFAEYEILDQSVIVVRTEDLGCGPSRTPAATAASGWPRVAGTCEGGFVCPFHGWCYGPDGANTRVTQSEGFAEHNLRARGARPDPGALRGLGRLRLDQPRRRRPAAAPVHRAVRHRARRLEGRVDAGRVVVRLPPPGQLEARPRRPSSSSTTCCSRTRSCASRAVSRPGTAAFDPARPSSRPSCTTCGP